MEPIPETSEAIEEFGPFLIDGDLLEQLRDRAVEVRRVVPDCVGMSLAAVEYGVTFTLVATDAELAVLDAAPYTSGGSGGDAVPDGQVREVDDTDSMDEEAWRLFGEAGRQQGVASTLTLPILVHESVAGSVNLYASSPHAFEGRAEELARIFDAWAPGAVANADLSFSQRRVAEQAPQVLRDEISVQVAAGILASSTGLDLDAAASKLHDAARRAGIMQAQLARALIELRRRDQHA